METVLQRLGATRAPNPAPDGPTQSDVFGGVDVYRTQMASSRASGISVRVPAAIIALACVLTASRAMAQSTIFNIPSTDTVDFKKNYVEFDFLPQAPGPENGAMTTIYNPRLVIGLPGNAEVGLNFPIFHNSDGFAIGSETPTTAGYIQPNIKWKFFKNDDKGLAAVVGGVLTTPLNSRTGQTTWGYIYGEVSMKYKGDHGPRVTVGGYGVIADVDPAPEGPFSFVGTRGGAILGYEQPIHGPLSFVADWFSSQNSIGYFTPGISVALPHNGLFNLGYSIGNDAWSHETPEYKNRYVFAYYGITF
jgi:hypothetical protein